MLLSLIWVARFLLDVLWWVLIIQIVLSWLIFFNVLNVHSSGVRSFVVAIDRMTEPLYRPFRKILPDFGGVDFSPFIVLLLIGVADRLLIGAQLDAARYYGP
jgi:YggT family protein